MKTWIDFAFGAQIDKIGSSLEWDSKLFYSLLECLKTSDTGDKEYSIRFLSIPLSSVRELILTQDLVFISISNDIPRFVKRSDLVDSNVPLPEYIKP